MCENLAQAWLVTELDDPQTSLFNVYAIVYYGF